MTRPSPRLFALLAPFLLGACFSFGAKPPPDLMTLTPAARVPIATTRSAGPGEGITVTIPTVVQELKTVRVPVRSRGVAVAYVKDAQWVEMPDRLFRELLSETIAVRTGRVVLDDRQRDVDPGVKLGGQLLAFGVDADTSEAVATYNAQLIRVNGGGVTTRRFETRVPLAIVDRASVAVALNRAANTLAVDVADWIAR